MSLMYAMLGVAPPLKHCTEVRVMLCTLAVSYTVSIILCYFKDGLISRRNKEMPSLFFVAILYSFSITDKLYNST